MGNLKWGIVGAGAIAGRFAESLATLEGHELWAIGSRNQDKAERFARGFGAQQAYGSYEALVQDPNIQVVYVATPHPLHCPNTLMALQAGKHVLCEKPFALNAAQAQQMIEEAKRSGLFLMEAMWTRFQPSMVKVREILQSGVLGHIELVQAEFGFQANVGPEHRILNPELGGGALLDVGIYPVSFASMVLGTPQSIDSEAVMGSTGVDEEAVLWLSYPGEVQAELACSVRKKLGNSARIYGSEGYLEVTANFWHSQKLILMANDQEQHLAVPFEGHGDQFQAIEVQRCLAQGLTESPIMPLAESLSIMQTLDAIRAQWELRYPGEA